jgi:Protein of unknown function (DUF455)
MIPMAKNYGRPDPARLLDVRSNASQLATLYTVEVELARLAGGWVARLPELPEKLLLGRITFEDADHAQLLERRLLELRSEPEAIEAFRRRGAAALLALERLAEPRAFLAGLFRVVKPAVLADLRRHLDACPPYVDEPTVRILHRVIADEEDHIAVGLALLAERGVSWAESERVEAELRSLLWDLDADGRDLDPARFVGSDPVPVARPAWPAAVRQLAYEEPAPPYPDDFDAAMRRCVHDLVFSETEALDIFGRYLYELAGSGFPWEFHHEAARVCWDEARHVELLLNVLERYGGSVGEFPAKAPGYEEYHRQPGTLEKLIMVNVIAEGEVSTDTQTQHREAFRSLGDELSALFKDYEMADEVVHGRFGVKWSRWLAERTGADYEAAYRRARAALEDFKSQHDDQGSESPIPLVRLGVDETGAKRVVNVEAKRLVGFSEAEIERIKAEGGTTVER